MNEGDTRLCTVVLIASMFEFIAKGSGAGVVVEVIREVAVCLSGTTRSSAMSCSMMSWDVLMHMTNL